MINVFAAVGGPHPSSGGGGGDWLWLIIVAAVVIMGVSVLGLMRRRK